MIEFDELLTRYAGLDRAELDAWIDAGWVLPKRHNRGWIFEEVDVARVGLILEMRRECAIDEEALPLVLDLLDQVYALRRQMRRLCDALAAQPEDVQAAIRQALTPVEHS